VSPDAEGTLLPSNRLGADTRAESAQSELLDPGIDDRGDEDTELVLNAVGA